MRTFTAYIEFDTETQLYVGIVPDVPGAHSIGATLDELRINLKDVLETLRDEHISPENQPKFVDLILSTKI
ncbi:MAG: type II toxin-antitoxin system HicB family antitoxin [Chloroflexota bacterium]